MKKLFVLFVPILLSVSVAACATREKPPVPTPTLSQFVLPGGATETPVVLPAGIGTAQPATTGAARGTPQGTIPSNFFATAGPPLATPTKSSGLPAPTTAPLTVPTSAPPPANTPEPSTSGACSNPYIVLRGEWAFQIARKCGVSYTALQAANPTVNLAVVYSGQRLNMPGGATKQGTSYIVRAGDTLASIAVHFGTTAYALQLANHLADANSIYVGQTLVIP
ncbi:MAG TPA: LysM peptidoglycan-binding domain-containing protein [Anaerolineae bacterium]